MNNGGSMKKTLAAACAGAALVISVTACGSPARSSGSTPDSSQGGNASSGAPAAQPAQVSAHDACGVFKKAVDPNVTSASTQARVVADYRATAATLRSVENTADPTLSADMAKLANDWNREATDVQNTPASRVKTILQTQPFDNDTTDAMWQGVRVGNDCIQHGYPEAGGPVRIPAGY